MEKDMARHVIRATFRSGRELEDLLGLLRENCSAEEYAIYARGIATAIASIQLEVMNRALAAHPEINDEIEIKMKKYGRFI